MSYWVCQYVGPQIEAQTYGYEFAVMEGLRQFSVSELCHTDGTDANSLFINGFCINVTADQIKSFLRGTNKLQIKFKIMKRRARLQSS